LSEIAQAKPFEMPDLSQSLKRNDLSYLQIVAGLWGLELEALNAGQALEKLTSALLDPTLVQEIVESLPADARLALDDLLQNQGRLSWSMFSRRYGLVREMGPGRRDRDRPYLKPVSPAEILWYRALVARAFFDTATGPQEFAYIPDDLVGLIPPGGGAAPSWLGRAATPAERASLIPISDRLLDHACTLLAALRLGFIQEDIADLWTTIKAFPSFKGLTPTALQTLLAAAGLLDDKGVPRPEPARIFLEASRSEAMTQLFISWLESPVFDELHLVPGLQVEGELEHDPVRPRKLILNFLSTIPGLTAGEERPFWSLPAFLEAVHYSHPDFLRPTGDYDSWFIRDSMSGEFIRGFEHWYDVEGAFIRYLLTGPLHWLGILDLAAPDPKGAVSAFRFSTWSAELLSGKAPPGLLAEQEAVLARSEARLRVPRLAPRAVRYQLARFCVWEGEQDDIYRYRITPFSLERAKQQGLTLTHLLSLLRRYARPVPPGLIKALERWEQKGTEARFQHLVVLRLASPDLLNTLRTSRVARFLGDPLGPTAVVVQPGAVEKVLAFLAELGYLGEVELDE
jgi:hypothetical protein